jgi:hypothetical protein
MVRLGHKKNTPQLAVVKCRYNNDFNMIGIVKWAKRVQKYQFMMINP